MANTFKNILSNKKRVSNLEAYFKPFREEIIGINQEFESPYGIKKNYLCRLDCKWKIV